MHKPLIHPFYRASAAAFQQDCLVPEQQHPAPVWPHKIVMCREKSGKNTVEGEATNTGSYMNLTSHNSEHGSPHRKFPNLTTILWFLDIICQNGTKINSDFIQYNRIILNVLLQNKGRISFIINLRTDYMKIPWIPTRLNLVFLIVFLHPREKKISLAIL